MNVSIIIVNYNTEQLVLDCINSIQEQTKGITFEIIVVDNNSENEPKLLKNEKRIKYIQSEINLGFGRANNLGSKQAKGDFLFFLNPDTILINNAISILYHHMTSHSNIGICGGNLYTNSLHYTHAYGILSPGILNEIMLFFLFKPLLLFKSEFNKTNKPIEVEYITGADLMIKRDLFFSINGFDKDFFMYFEETYLCYQIKSLGFKIINNPIAKIIHLEGKSMTFKKHKESLFYQGRKIYLTKRYNNFYYIICNILHAITCISRIILFARNNNKREMWVYRLRLLFT